MGKIEYDSNNSGGTWWLTDDDWKTLEAGGWKVEWYSDQMDRSYFPPDKDGRWMGALATKASKDDVSSMAEGVADFERLTNACATDAGCPCCGVPHNFVFTDDAGERYYGPTSSYAASF